MYTFAVNKKNYEDYSSGRVLYGATGATNYPVRLISEVFQQCVVLLSKQGHPGPYDIYDPFCGSAYALTILGFLHGAEIKSIAASDVSSSMLEVAKKNLALLTVEGLNQRVAELKNLQASYGKSSHLQALGSAEKLSHQIGSVTTAASFEFDILNDDNFPKNLPKMDMVLADLPYGKLSQWHGASAGINPAQKFLNNIKKILRPFSVVSISSNKKQAVLFEGYKKLKSLKVGTRKIVFLQPEIND